MLDERRKCEKALEAADVQFAQIQPGDPAIDLFNGAPLGKGAGYSDIEVALLQEAGLIGPQTVIVTTVHPLQVVDEALPETEHDFSVDLVVTPDEVIECGPPRRPGGLYWEHLTEDKIAAIPLLTARAAASAREHRMA